MVKTDDTPAPIWRKIDSERLNLTTLLLKGHCQGITDAPDLAAVTDPSKVKILSMLDVYSIPVLLSFESLRSLSLAFNDQRTDIDGDSNRLTGLLYQCAFLEVLDLTGATRCMDAQLLTQLGQTLNGLRLHEHEMYSGPQLRPILSLGQVEALGTQCPKLDELGLDIGYQGEWVSRSPFKAYCILTQFIASHMRPLKRSQDHSGPC